METPDVHSLLQQLEDLLANQRSVAATGRLLKSAGLTHYSEATFRSHWNGPRAWIQGNVRAGELPKILALLKDSPVSVVNELSAIEQLSNAGYVPVEAFGAPVYVLP
jgi:hypothetical protein